MESQGYNLYDGSVFEKNGSRNLCSRASRLPCFLSVTKRARARQHDDPRVRARAVRLHGRVRDPRVLDLVRLEREVHGAERREAVLLLIHHHRVDVCDDKLALRDIFVGMGAADEHDAVPRHAGFAEELRHGLAEGPGARRGGRAHGGPRDGGGGPPMARSFSPRARGASCRHTAGAIETPNKRVHAFEERFGEGTAFDLDYGKLLIIALCIYIAVQVS